MIMRFLSLHCEYFRFTTTKKSRSKLLEELNEFNRQGAIENCLVLLISVEKQDEMKPQFIEKGLNEILQITSQLKVSNIVLLSFAHLFGELSSPDFGLQSLKSLENELKDKGFNILRPPFGWFNELELKAKGHPLSRMSRIVE